MGRVPRLLGRVDPHRVRLPRRRSRVLPRDRGGVAGAAVPRPVQPHLGLRARRPDGRRARPTPPRSTGCGSSTPPRVRCVRREHAGWPRAGAPRGARPRLAACPACTRSSCCPTTPAATSYAVTGRRCATPDCPPSSTTAAPPTARTSRWWPHRRWRRRTRSERARARRGAAAGGGRGRRASRSSAAYGLAGPPARRARRARPRRARPPSRLLGVQHLGWLPHVTLARRVAASTCPRHSR